MAKGYSFEANCIRCGPTFAQQSRICTGIKDLDLEPFNLRLLLPTIDTHKQLNAHLFLMIVFTQRVHIRGIAGLLPTFYYITRKAPNI